MGWEVRGGCWCAEYKMKEYGREEGLAAGTMRVALMDGWRSGQALRSRQPAALRGPPLLGRDGGYEECIRDTMEVDGSFHVNQVEVGILIRVMRGVRCCYSIIYSYKCAISPHLC